MFSRPVTVQYVQQANSVFAGISKPAPDMVEDKPSGEDQASNFYGVSHFPCCITNFPQGWPKFAQSAVMAATDGSAAFVVASLVPLRAAVPIGSGATATVVIATSYPFGDSARVSVHVPASATTATAHVRIPGWADAATIDGAAAANGTLVAVRCAAGKNTSVLVQLNPAVRLTAGWGVVSDADDPTEPPTNAMTVTRGALLFALHPVEDRRVVHRYDDALPDRPKAVDYEISTKESWAFALMAGGSSPADRFTFSSSPSAGWSPAFPFDTENYPFSILAPARPLSTWGYWQGTNITAQPPPSPVDCEEAQAGCGAHEQIRLTPFGATNIRISVWPWVKE